MGWKIHPDFEPVHVTDYIVTSDDDVVQYVVTSDVRTPDGVPFEDVSDEVGEAAYAAWHKRLADERQSARSVAIVDARKAYDEQAARYKKLGWSDADIIAQFGPRE